MSIANKIANKQNEEDGRRTSRPQGRGLSPTAFRSKRIRNRMAKRAEARLAFKDSGHDNPRTHSMGLTPT